MQPEIKKINKLMQNRDEILKDAQKRADEKLAGITEKNQAVIEKLEKSYAENGDKWVNEIVERVIN